MPIISNLRCRHANIVCLTRQQVNRLNSSIKSDRYSVTVPALVMGIHSDVLYPEHEQRQLVELLPKARYAAINSPHGHDAFLIEFPQVAVQVRSFLESVV